MDLVTRLRKSDWTRSRHMASTSFCNDSATIPLLSFHGTTSEAAQHGFGEHRAIRHVREKRADSGERSKVYRFLAGFVSTSAGRVEPVDVGATVTAQADARFDWR